MKHNIFFSLELTRLELSWLAGNLGCIQFPLLGISPEMNTTPDELNAQDSLSKRGLIKVERRLHVDRILLLLAQLLANPEIIFSFYVLRRSGIENNWYAYPFKDFTLVVKKNDVYKFILSKDMDLSKEDFSDLPSRTSVNQKFFSISRDLILSLVNIIPENVSLGFSNTDSPSKKVTRGDNVPVKQMSGVIIRCLHEWVNGDLSIVKKSYMTWNEYGVWKSDDMGVDNIFRFKSCNLRQAVKWINNDASS
jgi:hypothetical protein